jgi:hypothetical protein
VKVINAAEEVQLSDQLNAEVKSGIEVSQEVLRYFKEGTGQITFGFTVSIKLTVNVHDLGEFGIPFETVKVTI